MSALTAEERRWLGDTGACGRRLVSRLLCLYDAALAQAEAAERERAVTDRLLTDQCSLTWAAESRLAAAVELAQRWARPGNGAGATAAEEILAVLSTAPAQAAEPDDFRTMLREMAQSWRDEAFGGQHCSELRSNILEECASELDAALGDAASITADRRLSGTPEAASAPAQAACDGTEACQCPLCWGPAQAAEPAAITWCDRPGCSVAALTECRAEAAKWRERVHATRAELDLLKQDYAGVVADRHGLSAELAAARESIGDMAAEFAALAADHDTAREHSDRWAAESDRAPEPEGEGAQCAGHGRRLQGCDRARALELLR